MNDNGSQDVTLVCGDKTKIKAHKIILKACSPVFASILDHVNFCLSRHKSELLLAVDISEELTAYSYIQHN